MEAVVELDRRLVGVDLETDTRGGGGPDDLCRADSGCLGGLGLVKEEAVVDADTALSTQVNGRKRLLDRTLGGVVEGVNLSRGAKINNLAGGHRNVVNSDVAARTGELERVLQSRARNVRAEAEERVRREEDGGRLVECLARQDGRELALGDSVGRGGELWSVMRPQEAR